MSRRTTGAAGSLEDVLERVRRVPPLHDFPGVDALLAWFDTLADDHPGLVRRRRIGTSRLGEPLWSYAVGHGPRRQLLFAGVHPNEPIGFRTLQHLAAELVADEELREASASTWHLVPCIDPDGTRLNEGWFGEPGDRTTYARRFYRPAPDEQVEWSFPFAHRDAWFDAVIPETQALMRLIDDVRPELMMSLHNAEMGGVYYYLSEDVPGVVPALHAVPRALGLPLDTGEPESPSLRRMAPAVYWAMSTRDEYEYLESLGLDAASMVGGESSAAYAARYGTVSLVAELPYWSHPLAEDDTPTSADYADVVRAKGEALVGLGAALAGLLDEARPDLTVRTPFLRASEAFVPMMSTSGRTEIARAAQPGTSRPATAAEVFSTEDVVRCFRLRFGGMLLRALDAEVSAGIATARVRRVLDRGRALYEEWVAEAEGVTGVQVLPVEKLVGVQYGAALATVRGLADRAAGAVPAGTAAGGAGGGR
ncbi:M14 family zinc carboxypeptidase [Cellulomonas sp. C5510]|uniref:M14 family zinc carboxypeptidase n=1 Tax=Cellulomonas sp. C5510 TaxID=2871170 RepID=UPI001C9794B2|nr:M14 family zinc carboxypeptidase [Cellulomonas sp. C5510]QZN85260.1 peptidase M14 [Cellulomonas sp. C5510]